MKNRNTKVIGGDHIYAFIFSLLCLISGCFFSLRSIPEVSIILFSLSLNLFLNWCIFKLFTKRKLKHLTEYFHNIHITVFSSSAFVATLVLTAVSILFEASISSGLLILIFATVSILGVPIGLLFYKWEEKVEKLVMNYRMADWRDKEKYLLPLQNFITNDDPKRVLDYVEKNNLFDQNLDEFLRKQIQQQ